MPVLISDEDYKEYRILQNNSIFQQKLDSVRGMKNLKYDIDLPIRRLVAMFALLGCEPIWSCCGFDYDGQPMHKSHEYGAVYIVLNKNEQTKRVIENLVMLNWVRPKDPDNGTSRWVCWQNDFWLYLQSDFDYEWGKTQYPWSLKSCLHYCEIGVIQINNLERVLENNFRNDFTDTVILHDSNKRQKERVSNWQYPLLEDWIITKNEIFTLSEQENKLQL